MLTAPPAVLCVGRYDSGDVVRLVDERALRLPPAKGWYAYRLELTMVGIIVGLPLGAFLAVSAQDPGLVFLPLLVGCGFLLALRVVSFAQGFNEYYTAGCLVLSMQAALFILPLLFLVIGALLGLNATSMGLSWMVVSIMMIVGLVLSLPYLYMKRVTFAYRLLPLILLFSIGSINASLRLDGAPVDYFASATVAPGILILWRLMRFRSDLGAIWDVSLIIRPIAGATFKPLWVMQQLGACVDRLRRRDEEQDEDGEDELGMGGAEDAEPSNLTSIKSIPAGPETD